MRSFIFCALALFAVGFHRSAYAVIPCDPSDSGFVCGLHNPEDLVRLPGTHWVIASSLNLEFTDRPHVRGPGPLSAIRIDTREVGLLFPAPDSTEQWDRKTYPDCVSAPKPFMSLGLYAQRLSGGRFRVLVANRGERESVEIVDVAAQSGRLHATWRGCVKVPEELGIWPNGVAPLPSGGLVLSGNHLAIWRPGQGWKKIETFKGRMPDSPARSDAGMANGLEVSRDGRWIFVADTVKDTVTRLSVEGNDSPEILKLDFPPGYFWPDNLRWGEDGALYLSGPYSSKRELPADCYQRTVCDEFGTGIARIDPEHMTARVIYRDEGIQGQFGAATTALQIGDRFWIGTSVGDRLAIVEPQP